MDSYKSDCRRRNPRFHFNKKANDGNYMDICKTGVKRKLQDYNTSLTIVVKSTGTKKKKNNDTISICSKFLKKWDFYYDEASRNFHGKILYWNDFAVPAIIKGKLSDIQLEMLMDTPFAHYISFGSQVMFSQIIHQALIREIYVRDTDEMWFDFGERRVRFGLPEFCVISGLNGQWNLNIDSFIEHESDLVAKYFGNVVVSRSVIEAAYQNVVFVDDVEAVRLSVIYLVFNFLLAGCPFSSVDRALLNYAASGDLETFSWGKVCFMLTKKSLSTAVKGKITRLKDGSLQYKTYNHNYTRLYKLSGLPYCFQIVLVRKHSDVR